MTDSDELDREKELSERFASHTRESMDTDESAASQDSQSTNDPQDSNDAHDTDNTNDAGDTNDAIRNRRQYVMYLPEDLHQALNERYSRYDGIAKIKTGEGIEKHKDFNEAIVRTALNSANLDDNVGVSSSLED